MRNFKVIAVALVLVLGAACKKKKTTDTGGSMGTAAGTGATMAGSGDGTGGSMAGSNTMGSGGSNNTSGSAGSAGSAAATEPPKQDIVTMLAADMKWGPMDPANPDAAPMVAPLWGDMQNGPNGFLIKVKAGSKGGWHTHSNAYHGVTISGAPNHLQDGETKPVPLPAPAYWFEPAGAVHNSQCLGKEDCIGVVHFNEGKADMAPAEPKKGGKKDPKFVQKVAKDLKWQAMLPDLKDKSPMVADLWGDPESEAHGRFWKFPAGFTSPAHTHTSDHHAVVIKGIAMNYAPDDKAPKEIGPGGYWMQRGNASHITACKAGADCIVYTYTLGKYDFVPVEGDAAGGDMKGGDMKGSAAGGDMKGSAAGGDMKGGDKKGGDKKGSDAKK